MTACIFLVVLGLVLLIFGADILTGGSVAVARRYNVSEWMIGVTILAIGTSMPELVVSLASAIKGNPDMAVGNVIGSNTFNSLLILGVTALFCPIRLTRKDTQRNIPQNLIVTGVLIVLCSSVFGLTWMPEKITRIEGLLMLAGFILFMVQSSKRPAKSSIERTEEEKREINRKGKWAPLMIAGGIAFLILGCKLLLDNGVILAESLGVSKFVISVTLMAGGTSLPELATSIAAARRRSPQMALGNIIGSNIANILLILGLSSSITPLSLSEVSPLDMLILLSSALMLLSAPFMIKRQKISRLEGAILVLVYLAYIYSLLVR